mgnify:CR=1 FL=1
MQQHKTYTYYRNATLFIFIFHSYFVAHNNDDGTQAVSLSSEEARTNHVAPLLVLLLLLVIKREPASSFKPCLRLSISVTTADLVTSKNQDHHVTSLRPLLHDPIRPHLEVVSLYNS